MKFFKPNMIIFLCCTFNITIGLAQSSTIEKLSRSLAEEKTDSNKVSLLWQLAEQYQSFKPDTSLLLSQKALLLAQRIKFVEGESRSLAILATSQYLLGDYPKALNNYLLKLKIEEKRNSPRNYASALNNIGITYMLLEDYTKALEYLNRADSTVTVTGGKAKEELKYQVEVNIGETFYRMNLPDSATIHFNTALTLVKSSGDSAALGAAVLGMANVMASKNELANALHHYRDAFTYLSGGPDTDIMCEVSLGIAKIYEKLKWNDSATYFGNMSYSLAEKSKFLSRQLDAALFLSRIYKKLNDPDRAFSFLEQAAQLKDSIMGHQKIKSAISLSIYEKLRQVDLAEQKIQDQQVRYKQLQMLIIALCIPALFLITLLISRIKVNRKLIRFMGILSLLFLFEFLTLLLHPIIANFTNHILVLELLIFVCIAAMLVPAHHRLEQILINRLTHAGDDPNTIRIATKKIVLKE